jgi:lipid-binding SYLF domain-containing protein
MSRKTILLFALLPAFLSTAWSIAVNASPPANSAYRHASSHAQTERDARNALHELYKAVPHARTLGSRASAILVFPDMLKAGLLVGGAGGNGVLFSRDGHVLGHYNSSALSYGLQAGAQNFSEALFLMTPNARKYLDRSEGWSIGAEPNIVVADAGIAHDYSSTTVRPDVYSLVFAQSGLMAGIGV